MSDRVFVYGTLLHGQSNHSWLADAELLGSHSTEPVYTMYDVGPYPAVVGDGNTSIHGEVYAISDRILTRLDELEDYPTYYDRIRIGTPWGDAWMYLFADNSPYYDEVPGGDWRAHQLRSAEKDA